MGRQLLTSWWMPLLSTTIDGSGLVHRMILVHSSFPIIDNLVAQRIRTTTQLACAVSLFPSRYHAPPPVLPADLAAFKARALGCGFCGRRYGRKRA
jgi:hypothetical protein